MISLTGHFIGNLLFDVGVIRPLANLLFVHPQDRALDGIAFALELDVAGLTADAGLTAFVGISGRVTLALTVASIAAAIAGAATTIAGTATTSIAATIAGTATTSIAATIAGTAATSIAATGISATSIAATTVATVGATIVGVFGAGSTRPAIARRAAGVFGIRRRCVGSIRWI